MTFERIVRPFQTGNVSPPTRIAPAGDEKPSENVLRIIGKGGRVITYNGSSHASASYYMEAVETEFAQSPSRKTHVKRITNPDDESQFIDVEVIDEITFRGPNGQVVTLRLNNEQDQQ